MKYEQTIVSLINSLGGVENIKSSSHCVTRVRLVIKDPSLIDDINIRSLEGVEGTVLRNHNYHIVIGLDIEDFYHQFDHMVNFETELSTRKSDLRDKTKFSWLQNFVMYFSEIFVPLIPALVAGGLILGIRNILEASLNGYVIIDHIQFFKGLDEFLWIPAEAIFWYLPVSLSWSIFKNKGGSEILGIVLGLSMLIAPLININDIAKDHFDWIWNFDLNKFGFDFGFFHFPWKISYTGQVIPSFIVATIAVNLEKKLNELVPTMFKQILVPLGVILLGYTLAMAVVGPIGWTISTAVSFASSWAFTHPILKYVFAPIFGFLYAPLVITGIHHMLDAVIIQNTTQLGGSMIFPILAISNICQGAAVLAFVLRHRTRQKTNQIGYSAVTSAWLGVTEPAMFGINTKYIYPFVASIIGASVGSFFLTLFGVTSNGIGSGGVLGILSIQDTSLVHGVTTWFGSGHFCFFLSTIIAVVVTIVMTFVFSRKQKYKDLELEVGVE